jgi:hypothetical protein
MLNASNVAAANRTVVKRGGTTIFDNTGNAGTSNQAITGGSRYHVGTAGTQDAQLCGRAPCATTAAVTWITRRRCR